MYAVASTLIIFLPKYTLTHNKYTIVYKLRIQCQLFAPYVSYMTDNRVKQMYAGIELLALSNTLILEETYYIPVICI